jgi:hypothetical protein
VWVHEPSRGRCCDRRLRRLSWIVIGGLAVALAAEQPAHGLGRDRVHGGGDVGVQVQGDADLAVAEQVAHDLGVDALPQQQRGAAVAQVVEADAGQASAIKQRVEAPLPQVVWGERLAEGVGEDQAVLLPARLSLFAVSGLPGAVVDQRGCGQFREQHGPAGLGGS